MKVTVEKIAEALFYIHHPDFVLQTFSMREQNGILPLVRLDAVLFIDTVNDFSAYPIFSP